ncbi:ADP-ribosylglycohydrolase family protein [Phytoactinopolyspora halotolerans]|uniref:ADP-ribosylglycohydrolase family protein n=1 Tax=Phytoactinopolyspora halotolerans TaxID=1981512 RepID=A0A6L9S708_9ACTN|nr:ADP-ribosylglycohydrolase family protein [Phytoactinopolyspora halotolerans]NEE00956.1 ADP-ribosylglycohydrolase family protein [Phytoactinopolyspora halotolerans]
MSNEPGLTSRAVGCLLGAAVGDALGGATEGWSPAQIVDRWGGWVEGIVSPYYADWQTARPIAPYHKGDGHITDDTLMTHLMVEVYAQARAHLTAYDMAQRFVPLMLSEQVWIPELEKEALPLQRVFLAEKYMALRLHWGHADPREAGVGNAVNCGAAMYIAPVGIVNAADPDAAYAEALDVAGAHQSSYGREAAGVMAACVAAAARPGASVDDVIDAALRLAKDGTRGAIEAVTEAAAGVSHWAEAVESGVLRAAMRPFDTVGENYRDQGLGARRPSRLHSIEELPIALAMLVISKGEWRDAVLGGVNYGRDSDSIASMAGAIAGTLGGRDVVPTDLASTVSTASRTDLVAPGVRLAEVTAEIRAADRARRDAADAALRELTER